MRSSAIADTFIVVPAKAGISGNQSAASRKFAAFTGTMLISLALSGCMRTDLPAGNAPLDPVAFFTGDSRGTGTLDPIIGRDVPIRVESRGTRQGDTLNLVQRITEGSKPTRTRLWKIRTLPNGGYIGTLTDAEGMVAMDLRGPRAYIRYTTPSGMNIRQQLALQADGRTIHNRLEAFKYGIRLATLDETIRKPVAK